MAPTILRQRWDVHLPNIRQFEYGVRVDEDKDDFSLAGAEIRALINHWQSRGRGQVMPLYDLRRLVMWRWYEEAIRPRDKRAVEPQVTAELLDILNDPNNGITVVKLCGRCDRCGGTHR